MSKATRVNVIRLTDGEVAVIYTVLQVQLMYFQQEHSVFHPDAVKLRKIMEKFIEQASKGRWS